MAKRKPSVAVRNVSRRRSIESFIPIARRLALAFGHWSLDDSDLLQSAMVAACRAVDSFDPARGTPLTAYVVTRMRWELCRVVTSCVRETGGHRKRLYDPVDPSSAVDDDSASDLWDAIEQLPARDRSILIAFYGLDDHKPRIRAAIASDFNWHVSTITKSTTRSVNALKVALESA